jgi:2-keto-4-pentenoate hydratase
MNAEQLQSTAANLLAEQRARRVYRKLEGSIEQAYAVQACFQRLACAAYGHGPLVGYKVALTSQAMQTMVGVDEPLAGGVFADRVLAAGGAITLANHVHLGMEFEVAVRMTHTLHGAGDAHSAASIAASVAGYAPAYELVDDRHADYTQINAFSVIAENSWNAGVILGEFVQMELLASAKTQLWIDGEIAGEGCAGDALGHPLEAVAWLANHLNARGEALQAGEFVMTGSSIRTTFPVSGQNYRFVVAGLGAIEARFV